MTAYMKCNFANLLRVTTAFLATVFPASAASILNDGSFETATPGNHTPGAGEDEVLPVGSTAMAGWTVVGSSSISWLLSGFAGISAEDGNDYLDLTGPGFGPTQGGVQQTVTLSAGSYTLTFYLGSLDNNEPDSVLASAGDQSNVVFTNSDTGAGFHWNQEKLNFNVAADGPVTISLVGDPADTLASSPFVGLDNVVVSPAPEPSTALLAFSAFGGLLLASCRKVRCASACRAYRQRP